jgi:hypothetical protein
MTSTLTWTSLLRSKAFNSMLGIYNTRPNPQLGCYLAHAIEWRKKVCKRIYEYPDAQFVPGMKVTTVKENHREEKRGPFVDGSTIRSCLCRSASEYLPTAVFFLAFNFSDSLALFVAAFILLTAAFALADDFLGRGVF